MSDVVGRKIVSRDGRLIGTVEDVLIDDADGHIVGYALNERAGGRFEELIAREKHADHSRYLRADADLQAGRNLIVAPEDAVARTWDADASELRFAAPMHSSRRGWEH